MKTATNSQRQKLLVLLAWCLLLMLAWGLWLWRLNASDLTFDEAATYSVAHRPSLEILGYLRKAVREHPPVYYLLIHGWMVLAGTGEFSMRLFSVGAGLVALEPPRFSFPAGLEVVLVIPLPTASIPAPQAAGTRRAPA